MVEANETSVDDEKQPPFHPLSCAKCGAPLPVERDATTLFCERCGLGYKSLSPPPLTQHHMLGAGDKVAVSWGDRWWPAHIVEMVSRRQYLVHYEGWGPKYDEVVDASRIRVLDFVPGASILPPKIEPVSKVQRADPLSAAGILLLVLAGLAVVTEFVFGDRWLNPKASRSEQTEAVNFGAITEHLPGVTLRPDFRIEPGQTFYVKWGHGWYLGTVVMVENQSQIMIQYDGWGDYQNEIVTRDRLRIIP